MLLQLLVLALISAWASEYSRMELDSVMTPQELKLSHYRAEQMHELGRSLGRHVERQRSGAIYFQIAELAMQEYHFYRLQEGKIHEKRLASGISENFIAHSFSKKFLQQGVKACDRILELKLASERKDEIYYFLGFYADEDGQHGKARSHYEALVKHCPESKLVPSAQLALGDSAYADRNYQRAYDYYKQSFQKIEPEKRPKMEHRMAWCLYHRKQYQDAIAAMTSVIKTDNVQIRYEALYDLGIFLPEIYGAREAMGIVDGVQATPEIKHKIYQRLADQYEKLLRIDDARTMLAQLNDSPVRGILMDLRHREYDRAAQSLEQLKEVPKGADLTQLRALVRHTATETHKRARKGKRQVDRLLAVRFYKIYREHLAENQEIAEISMYEAEVLRDLGHLDDAIAAYERVIKAGASHYAKDASELLLALLAKRLSQVPHTAALAPLERAYVDNVDRIAGYLPARRAELQLKAAQVLAGHKDSYQEAETRAMNLLHDGNKEVAYTAAKLLLQISKNPSIRQVPEILAYDKLHKNGALSRELESREEQSLVHAIADHEHHGDYLAAAKGYVEFADRSTNPIAQKKALGQALRKLAPVMDQQGEFFQQVLGRFLAVKSPDTDTLVYLATVAFIHGNSSLTSELLEKVGFATHKASFLETAGRLLEPKLAIALWSRAIEAHITSEHLLRLYGALVEQDDQFSDAAQAYRLCSKAPACQVALADLYVKSQDYVQAKKFYAQAAGNKTGFGGYARYKLAEMESVTSKIVDPIAKVKRLAPFYQEALKAGGPWGVAALGRLAQHVLASSPKLVLQARATLLSAYKKAEAEEILSPSLPEIEDLLASLDEPSIARMQGPLFEPLIAPSHGNLGVHDVPSSEGWVEIGNTFWQKGKLSEARIAYERALDVNAKNVRALNNYAVCLLRDGKWYETQEALETLRQAHRLDDLFLTATINRAIFLTYYRLFAPAEKAWQQVLARAQDLRVIAMAHSGMEIALFG